MKKRLIFFLSLVSAFTFYSCEETEKFNIEENNDPKSEVFDFKTRADVFLSLDFGFDGYSVPFEIFTSNPLDEDGRLIAGKSPIFAAFTDKYSSFQGKIELPAHTSKVYMYSDATAIDRLTELDVVNGRISHEYDRGSASTRATSYEGDCISIGTNTVTINANNKLFALYNDYNKDGDNEDRYIPKNTKVPSLYSIVGNNEKISNNSTLGQLLTRVNNSLKKVDNSFFCTDSKHTNLRISPYTTDGEAIEAVHIDLTYLAATGDYHNAMGYYYYKSGSTNPTAAEIKAMPKYMVFPRTTANIPNARIKARLQFFGENYDQAGVDNFPAGYTIGWLLVADIAKKTGSNTLDTDADISAVNERINHFYPTQSIYSNKEANKEERYGCISLYDSPSEKVIIGFEDQTYTDLGDRSYQDILFYVDCDPISAIQDPDRPDLPDPNDPETYKTETKSSTLAFEDIWPSGGDYDMNDVVVEIDNAITFNNYNQLRKIVTTVKAVHNGATLTNAFGLVFNGEIGSVDEEASDYFAKEENNQFILFDNILTSVGKTYKIVQTFEGKINKLTYDDSINPFIAISYKQGEKDRKEVHLPGNDPTPWIDQSLIGTGKDLFFVDAENQIYPFAFELFDIKNWEVVTEKSRIGSPGEYPTYNSWAESKGIKDTNWYLNKN